MSRLFRFKFSVVSPRVRLSWSAQPAVSTLHARSGLPLLSFTVHQMHAVPGGDTLRVLSSFGREMDDPASPFLEMVDALASMALPLDQWTAVVDMILMPLRLLTMVHHGVEEADEDTARALSASSGPLLAALVRAVVRERCAVWDETVGGDAKAGGVYPSSSAGSASGGGARGGAEDVAPPSASSLAVRIWLGVRTVADVVAVDVRRATVAAVLRSCVTSDACFIALRDSIGAPDVDGAAGGVPCPRLCVVDVLVLLALCDGGGPYRRHAHEVLTQEMVGHAEGVVAVVAVLAASGEGDALVALLAMAARGVARHRSDAGVAALVAVSSIAHAVVSAVCDGRGTGTSKAVAVLYQALMEVRLWGYEMSTHMSWPLDDVVAWPRLRSAMRSLAQLARYACVCVL